MSYEYVWGLFDEAVRTLVSSPKVTAMRLRYAYLGSLFKVEESDLDPDFWLRFSDVKYRLTKHTGKGGEGAIVETTSRMGQDEAAEIAESILSIFSDMTARHKIPENYERVPDLRRGEDE